MGGRKVDRTTFLIRVRPLPDTDPIRGMRELLKRMKRQFGFQCMFAVEEKDGVEFDIKKLEAEDEEN